MLKVANSVISASRITGVLPVVNGGTGVTTSTGTGNTVLSASPTLSGDVNLSTGNLVIGTAGKGIDFSITSSGSGTMTSELLADYEEGTWEPLAGANLTVAGTFSSLGTYTKIGRQVTVYGVLLSTTTVAWSGSNSQIVTGLPFTSNGDFPGTSMNGSRTQGAIIETSSTSIYAAQVMAATSAVTICVTYFV